MLVAGGVPLTRLELIDANDAGDRRYVGATHDGILDVHVIDRDTFGLASGRRLLRVLRLRSGFTRPPALTCLVHGEPVPMDTLKARIERELGWTVKTPAHQEKMEL